MNCLEFRRTLLADPQTRTVDIAKHQLACPACAEFAKQLRGFELVLKDAAKVDVPEGLASRIILRQRMAKPSRNFWWNGLVAIAATLILTMGVWMLWPRYTGMSLEESVLAHVEDEATHLSDQRNVSLAKVNSSMKDYGAQLTVAVAKVNFAMPCDMRLSKGYHMVLQGETGPVTVLIMPGDYIDQRKTVADQRFKGVIMPTRTGSMAIVAENDKDLAMMEQKLKESMHFA